MLASSDWTALHARLHRTLRSRQLLPKQQSVLVAVSGGQDSLCLLKLLLDLQPKWQWRLGVAHCNHRWRADEDDNAAQVAQLAQDWKLSYHEATVSEPVPTEAAARAWRYRVLAEIATAQAFSFVATGHTASDRAETLLYNLLRGSGMDGLPALAWRRSLTETIQVVRPLLELSRAETGDFCRRAALPVWEDITNQDQRYARNRIRRSLIPTLQADFNPQVEQALAQTAELLRADLDYLQTVTEQLWQQIASPDPNLPQSWRLDRLQLQVVSLALQRRLLRRWLQTCLQISSSFEQIEKLVALLSAPHHSQTDPFPGGAIAYIDRQWLCLKLGKA